MAPKRNAHVTTPLPAPSKAPSSLALASTTPERSISSSRRSRFAAAQSWNKFFANLASHYLDETSQRTKLIDAYMAFLIIVGALQFLYCVLACKYPFNAFLAGFSASVGQFVLTASLRIQTAETNKSDFPSLSPERAFTDYIVCSLILHFFCVNFIN